MVAQFERYRLSSYPDLYVDELCYVEGAFCNETSDCCEGICYGADEPSTCQPCRSSRESCESDEDCCGQSFCHEKQGVCRRDKTLDFDLDFVDELDVESLNETDMFGEDDDFDDDDDSVT